MDKIVSKIASLGIPGLILLIAIDATGYAGAAAMTAALASIGPGGMLGGIITLGIGVLIVDAISKYGFEAIYRGVIRELYKRGETKESILNNIDKYPISGDLKRKLKEILSKL